MPPQLRLSPRRAAEAGGVPRDSRAVKTAIVAIVLGLASAGFSAERPADDANDLLFLADHGLAVIRLRVEVNGQPQREIVKQNLLGFCRAADRDLDGWLTEEEYNAGVASHPVVQEILARGMPRSGTMGDRPEFGAAGKLPLEQLADFLLRHIFSPLKVEFSGQQMRRISDAGEFLERPLADVQLFERLDTDGNKRLTSRELERAARVLNKLDFNDDEIISINELRMRAAPTAMPAANRNNTAPRGDGHLIQLSPERIDAQFIRRVLSMYDGEAKGSVKDLRLDRNEINLPEDLFANADADQDGYWDFDELGRFLQRPAATAEILVHQAEPEANAAVTGANGSRSLVELSMAGESGTRMQATLPGLLKFEIHGVRFNLRVLLPARNAGQDEVLTAQFRALDADKNEYLELKEFNSAGEAQSQAFFRAIDADGDEKVYLAEFLGYNRLVAQIRDSQQVLTVENLGRTLFGPLDANGDGQLSQRELADLKSRFPEWDLDGDGKLNETEIPQQYRLALTSGANGLFGANGVVAGIVEFNIGGGNAPSSPPASAPKWFLKMDRNRDGEVSAREFLGTAEGFQKIDANADGAIDAAEAATVK